VISDRASTQPYEAPAVEERTKVDVPLIGTSGPSAVFRPAPDATDE
jgi:hypothetical protein